MPLKDSAQVFHQWSKTYGAVMHLHVLGRTMIILDSYEAAGDLLDKRGLIYSDRPKFTLYELLGWNPSTTFLRYGSKSYTTHRQMHQSYLTRHKLEDFKPIQTQEARTLLRNLIGASPEKYDKFISRFATGIITQIVAGHRITSDDDPYLRLSDMVYESMAKATGPPGNSLLDFIPLLQHFPLWFPGAKDMAGVKAGRPVIKELYEYPLRTVKEQQASAWGSQAIISTEQLQNMQESEEQEGGGGLKGAAATMFGAGEATTWTSLSLFVLAMVLHPECQAKAQKEIDSVVGKQRLPEFGDRDDLPFVEGILQETFRLTGNTVTSVPHCVTEDDVYRGMLIPKGSLVFANIKGMSLDENVYSNPTSFNPERYLPDAGEPKFSTILFGFGRRICTGQHVADNSLWIAIASILATFKITNAVDENGKIIVPENTRTDGLVSHPNDMRCIISPRSPAAEALILETETWWFNSL
ncbi:cytochrome P450 [Mycena galopus ATCC 62051]|nr:cytochrome P450 [Mycena galopus ATCC 62051]